MIMQDKSSLFMDILELDTPPFLNLDQQQDDIFLFNGSASNDDILGSQDSDILLGLGGNDTIQALSGDDWLHGNRNNDWLSGNLGEDSIYGGQGKDTIYGGKSQDFLLGNREEDWLSGNREQDTIYGGDNNDIIYGGQDNDLLYGESGEDTLFGDAGTDTLQGGSGLDIFILGQSVEGSTSAETDVILDFRPDEDLIDLVEGLTPIDLSLEDTGSGDVAIRIEETGETLAVVRGIDTQTLNFSYFVDGAEVIEEDTSESQTPAISESEPEPELLPEIEAPPISELEPEPVPSSISLDITPSPSDGEPSYPGYLFIYEPGETVTYDANVELWQQRMQDLGFEIDVDGLYGPQSESVARQFQESQGLDVDGIVGPNTWEASFDTSPEETPPPPEEQPTTPEGIEFGNYNPIDEAPEFVTDEFLSKVFDISQGLEIIPEYLMAVMGFETGGSYDPSVSNPNSSATGLIQFLESTAEGLGTSTAELASMTAVEQLDYVEEYYSGFTGELDSLEDTYTAVLAGGTGKDVLFVEGSGDTGEAYDANEPLDSDENGIITAQEAATPVREYLPGEDLFAEYRNVELDVPAAAPSYPGYAFSYNGEASVPYDENVELWQKQMEDLGYDLTVDGLYGPESESIAREFQEDQGLAVDGIVGPNTWEASFAVDDPVDPPGNDESRTSYTIESGDTLSEIAEEELGDSSRWREIEKEDGTTFTEEEARNIQPGDVVYLPTDEEPDSPSPTGPDELVPIPPDSEMNQGLTSPPSEVMYDIIGDPGNPETQVASPELEELLVSQDVGPFDVYGLAPAVDALERIFTRVEEDNPELYGQLGNSGMYNLRPKRQAGGEEISGTISNHSWGTAIDINIGGSPDLEQDGLTDRGLVELYPYFNEEGFYWGAEFSNNEDPIHFEASEELLEQWKAEGLLT